MFGGRNIGDEYVLADRAANFIGLDAVATGPIVDRLAMAFDAYWWQRRRRWVFLPLTKPGSNQAWAGPAPRPLASPPPPWPSGRTGARRHRQRNHTARAPRTQTRLTSSHVR